MITAIVAGIVIITLTVIFYFSFKRTKEDDARNATLHTRQGDDHSRLNNLGPSDRTPYSGRSDRSPRE